MPSAAAAGVPRGTRLVRLSLLRLVAKLLPTRPAAPGQPRRILLVRPDHLGDVLLTSPAIDWLAAALPTAEFTYLVGPWSAEVARRGSLGRRVATLRFPGFTRRPKGLPVAPYALLWREAARLRTHSFDAAVIFRPDHWWGALLALAAGIPVRLGFDLPETRPLLTHAAPFDPGAHAVEQALRLAHFSANVLGTPGRPDVSVPSSPPRLRFDLLAEDHAAATALLAAARAARAGSQERGTGVAPDDTGAASRRPLVAIHPTAGAEIKSWPSERWAALADGLAAAGASVLLTCGPGELAAIEQVQRLMAIPPLAVISGQPIGVLAALLARCVLVIGPDNGPLHLAAAVGTPTVRLYGPAPPSRFGPWPPRADQQVLLSRHLPCVPCGDLEDPPCQARHLPPCMLAHAVEDVLRASVDALAEPTTRVVGGGAARD